MNTTKNVTKKILFTDMDGTLLRDDATISDHTREVLLQMTRAGHKLVLSSGRSLDNIINTKAKLGLDFPGIFICATNGTIVYDCDSQQIIYERRLDMEDVKAIWPIAIAENMHIQTYSDHDLLVPQHDKETDFYLIKCDHPVIETLKPWAVLDKPPVKMLCIDLEDHERIDRFGQKIADAFPHLSVCFSNPMYLEIFDAKAGKGNTLVWLCDYLNIPLNCSFAAGDEFNDVSMIEAAGTGVAMRNSNPGIFKFADDITEFDNNSEGLSQYIVNKII